MSHGFPWALPPKRGHHSQAGLVLRDMGGLANVTYARKAKGFLAINGNSRTLWILPLVHSLGLCSSFRGLTSWLCHLSFRWSVLLFEWARLPIPLAWQGAPRLGRVRSPWSPGAVSLHGMWTHCGVQSLRVPSRLFTLPQTTQVTHFSKRQSLICPVEGLE